MTVVGSKQGKQTKKADCLPCQSAALMFLCANIVGKTRGIGRMGIGQKRINAAEEEGIKHRRSTKKKLKYSSSRNFFSRIHHQNGR